MLLFLIIAPDVGPINSSLRILSVDVSEGSAAVTLAFDVSDLLLTMGVCIDIYRIVPMGGRSSSTKN